MKENISIFTFSFLLVLLLTSCSKPPTNVSNQTGNNSNNVHRIEYIVGQKKADIKGDVDKQNIILLLKSLSDPVKQTPFNSNSKLVLYIDNTQINIDMSDKFIKLDNKVYSNLSISKQISSICENYLYRIDNYISLMKSKVDIELTSKDLSKGVLLTPDMKIELINLLKKPSRHYPQDEPFFLAPDYPYYQIVSKDASIPSVTIYKNTYIIVNSAEPEIYFISSQLYGFCLRYLPFSESNLTGLKKLYLCDELKLKSSDDGNIYKNKMLPIIRLLNESSLSNDKIVKDNNMIELMFYQDKVLTKVIIYKDGFLYKNSYYKYQNLKEIVINTLNAN